MKTEKKNIEEVPITLTVDNVSFIRYFIRSAMENLGKGKVNQAHHDSIAILLYIAPLLGENDNPYTEP